MQDNDKLPALDYVSPQRKKSEPISRVAIACLAFPMICQVIMRIFGMADPNAYSFCPMTLPHRDQFLINLLCYCGPMAVFAVLSLWSFRRKTPLNTEGSRVVALMAIVIDLAFIAFYSSVIYRLHFGYL